MGGGATLPCGWGGGGPTSDDWKKTWHSVYSVGKMPGVTKNCRLSWLTNSTLVYEPKCRGRRGVAGGGLSQWAQLYTGAQIYFGDGTPYSTYGKMDWIGSSAVSVTVTCVYTTDSLQIHSHKSATQLKRKVHMRPVLTPLEISFQVIFYFLCTLNIVMYWRGSADALRTWADSKKNLSTRDYIDRNSRASIILSA
jgi:hypothetical protein